MNIKFTSNEEQNELIREYPIGNILNYLTNILGENILIRDIIYGDNIMLMVNCLDNDKYYFIRMTKTLEEHPFISQIKVIIYNEDVNHFYKYLYTYTKDTSSSIICKINETYRKDNIWITKNAFGVKVEKETDIQEEKVKIKTR